MQGSFSPEERSEPVLTLPTRTLLVLCGPAGSGKSTFARHLMATHERQGWKPTMIVSSDACRAQICDDENSQQVNRDTFDLFHYIIHKRMFQNRFTLADSTALHPESRQRMLDLARRHNYHTCLLVFNISAQICLQRDLGRARQVGEQVIAFHAGLLQKTLQAIPSEGWNQILLLGEQDLNNGLEIALNT